MIHRIVEHAGLWLSLVGVGNLTTSYQGGTWFALEGTDELDVTLVAAFDGASSLTSISFRLVVSDDQAEIDPIESTSTQSATPAVEHVLGVSLGATVRDRVQTKLHRNAKFCRLEAKCVGAAAKAGDGATSSLHYTQG